MAHEGDHATLRNALNLYCAERQRDARLAWCRTHFLSARALSKAADVAAQLTRSDGGGRAAPPAAAGDEPTATFQGDSVLLRRALVAGFFLQVARRQPDGSYRTLVGGQTVYLHPSSVLFAAKAAAAPTHIVYNELVRTSKLYVRDVSAIEGAWLPELAPRFFKASVLL